MHNPWSLAGLIFSLLAILTVARGPIKRWYRKCRRRRGGVYLWRVDHHLNRARRVTGYVGLTNSFHLRARQHMGVSRFDPLTGAVVKSRGPGPATVKVPRNSREAGQVGYAVKVASAHALRWVLQAAGILLIVGGFAGWVMTR
jgi:hypothetical protein